MIITVLPFINFCKACCILYSFSGSAKAVASSNKITGASYNIPRAIEILRISPPDKVHPPSPNIVSYPRGKCII